jgi:CheY-like chemotaxis protein/tRNA A-37 threonylcarbamoyl transferase component Bud32
MDAASDFVKELFRRSDRYEVIDLVGQGGMGQVYKAIDRELDEVVALKVLKPRLSSDAAVIARFKQEIKLTRTIKHKNVARIFDLGEIGGFKFISMEYIDGYSLKDVLLSQGQLPIPRALHLYRQVLEGVAAAHDEGIIHRDIKPQNIMVSRDDGAYVLDFGIARSLESEDLFQRGLMMGSPAYMSTEQALRKEVDHRSDVYSLGVLLFELLTGSPPFRAFSVAAAAMKHVTDDAPDPRTLRPDAPEWLAHLVLRCLEKAPENRPQRVRDMLAEIAANADPSVTLVGGRVPAASGLRVVAHALAAHAPAAHAQLLDGPAPATSEQLLDADAPAASVLPDAVAGGRSVAVAPARHRALIAEADPESARLIRLKLESLGLHVDQVPDGVAAVDRTVHGRYDIVLLAKDLPRMDGLEAARVLRNYLTKQVMPAVPIYLLIPAGRSDQQTLAFDSGATDVLSKPVNGAALARMVRSLLRL